MKLEYINSLRVLSKYWKYVLILLLLVPLLMQTSCKKLVEVPPPLTGPVGNTVYSSNAKAIAAVTGIYNRMIESGGNFSSGSNSISVLGGLSADELKAFPFANSPLLSQAYTNALTKNNVPLWNELYKYIYTANTVIEGLAVSEGLTNEVKHQLNGEAKFMRAFCHFYLANFWGDVPLITTTDYRINKVAVRMPVVEVYKQIIADLEQAVDLLNPGYVGPDAITTDAERIRPNKWAAAALLARAYLYTGEWAKAEAQATEVINETAMYSLLSDLTGVFVQNSKEAIWQLQPIVPSFNTWDGYLFILPDTGPVNQDNPVAISNNLISAFETGDRRRSDWVGTVMAGGETYYYPHKYKVKGGDGAPVTEYQMVLRLGEQYLIRAEARAQADNTGGGVADLNKIRGRAGLPDYTGALDKATILNAIYHERQVELFTEWGDRWLDLKRTGRVNAVMSVVAPSKEGVWSSDRQLYPIPVTDIQNDPNLTQNQGY